MKTSIKLFFLVLTTIFHLEAICQLDLRQFSRDSVDSCMEEQWKGVWVRERAEYLFGDIDSNYRSYEFLDKNVCKFNYFEFGYYFTLYGQYFVKDSNLYIVTVWRDTSFISDVVHIEKLDSVETIDTRIIGGFSNRKTTYAKRVGEEQDTPRELPNKDIERQINAGFAERRPLGFS
jgi:hypothetical protein